MPTQINGTTGVDRVQDNVIGSSNIINGSITAPNLNGAQTGNPPIFGARAWCKFNGTLTGTNVPTAGGNVANVTRNATGTYTVNFTPAMPDADYAVVPFFRTTTLANLFMSRGRISAPTTSSFQFDIYNSGISLQDCEEISLVFYR